MDTCYETKKKQHFNKNEAGSGRCGVERKRGREGKLGRGYRRNLFSIVNERLERWQINGGSGVPVQH